MTISNLLRRPAPGAGPSILGVLLLAVTCIQPVDAAAQTGDPLQRQIQESQRRLEEIRAERERLQRDMQNFRARVEDVNRDLRNIERQLSTSGSVLAEIDLQVDLTATLVEENTRELLQTRERLLENSAVLERRLRDVYKIGPLHTVRVLLGAESITDLVNRYRYLRMIAAYDRSLVERVSALESALAAQNRELQSSLSELGRLRQTKQGEVAELRSVETEHQRALENFRSLERQTLNRIDQLAADEARMTDLIDDLEERRREAERRAAISGRAGAESPTISSGDEGSLEWPVQGDITYRFGVERRPDGTVLRWNGLGISAPPGTPVQAVRDGLVVMAGPFEGYGPTVVVSHGDGFYTLYLYLEEIGVVEGRNVETGQIVGTVGGRDTPEGPHIEFQIRGPVNGGAPRAMDPLRWLRTRSGGEGGGPLP